jgi:hypothetical protein
VTTSGNVARWDSPRTTRGADRGEYGPERRRRFLPFVRSYEPFDAAALARLYPTHCGYVSAVKESTEKNLKAGYILKYDADATIAEAEKISDRQISPWCFVPGAWPVPRHWCSPFLD